LVVAAHPYLAPVALIAARLANAPFIVACHGEEVWRPLRPSVAASLRLADAVLAPSLFTADQVMRWAGLRRPPVVIPHGLPPAMVTDRALDARIPGRVLTVARLVPEHAYKGVDTLLAAWPQVKATHPGAELVIVGDGADRPRLQAMVDGQSVKDVTFAGRVSDEELRGLYATASVFALPVRTRVGPAAAGEGLGLVFVEAAFWGLPVVAGNGGAVPEVVSDGETGILIDPLDPVDVGRAIVALLTDEPRAANMGARARERALERFSFETYSRRIGGLVRQLRPLPSEELDA
jgi:phosphatidylinositol alpha-1,6-mannosyltransferase